MDRFLIAPFNTGLENYLKPWLIPDDAFEVLQNAYVFRGRVKKRVGGRLMGGLDGTIAGSIASRFRINIDTTDGAGAAAGVVPGVTTAGRFGQAFSIGNEFFTVPAAGNPVVMLTTGASTTMTFDTTTGAYVFAGAAAATAVYYYPALPVMGLTVYENYASAGNDQPSYGFDTQFAYLYTAAGWERSGAALFQGDDLNFFWSTNWRGATSDIKVLFTTNFNFTLPPAAVAGDPIWWTVDGAVWTAGTGANAFYFAPGGLALYFGPYVKTARIIVGFKERLLLLNVVENNNPNNDGTGGTNTQYRNRCRYSFIGSPFAVNAWYNANQTDAAGNVAAGGGFFDASTDEAIISAEFIKDRLIVYFENSTWEIVYLNNPLDPFRWQKISDNLGSQSTFSSISFDKNVLTMGTTGVHACNGATVERIDEKIPDTVFQIKQENEGEQRVAGIRDFFTEMVYWAYPSVEHPTNTAYPNQMLVYNYRNGSWAINDDCITAFGYLEQTPARTWASTLAPWDLIEWTWSSGTLQANFKEIVAGNQEGFTFIVDPGSSINAPVLQVSAVGTSGLYTSLTIVNHNLEDFSYIALVSMTGIVFNTPANEGIFQVIVESANVVLIDATFTGVYAGGGTATRVSQIMIKSKQWNPYVANDRNVYLSKINFCVERTSFGQVTVDYLASSSQLSLLDEGLATGTTLGTNVLETTAYTGNATNQLERIQTRVWHPIYFQSDGECIQIVISLKDDIDLTKSQMRQAFIAFSPFELHGMTLHTMPTTDRMQ